jgi:hypothetical protein
LKVIDWDWGEKFNLAGYRDDRQDLIDRNKAHQVRIGTPLLHMKMDKLPYISQPTKLRDKSEEAKTSSDLQQFEKKLKRMEGSNRNQYNKILRRKIQEKAPDYLALLRERQKPVNDKNHKYNEVVFMNHLS